MKKNNSKVAAVLMAAVLAMGMLAGCNGSEKVTESSTNEVVAKTQKAETVGSTETAAPEDNASADASVAESTQTDSADKTETADSKDDKAGADSSAADSSADASQSVSFSKVDSSVISAKDALKGNSSELPAYEYPGPELFYTVLYDYVTNVLGKGYLPGDVTIPCPIIIAEDDSNKSDILVYGAFWVFNYSLSDDTLMTISGGSHPGLMHLKMTDEGYEVTGFDAVLDGSDYEPSAKKIFGDRYDEFQKTISDEKSREEIRAQIISNYAAANELNINGYQDYGWEKIALPTENIDSFYSTF